MIRQVYQGPRIYFAWLGFLGVLILIGVAGYARQLQEGLILSNMTDQVSWGAYIANFTYIVGLAAAAVMLVIPAYVYKIKSIKEILLVGELFAIASIVMCLLFVTVDMGRPDRLWHLIPKLGRMNWPISMLTWDVIVLNGYLLLNLHIPGYLLYKKYRGQEPTSHYYMPFVMISIFWAVSIHTVTAFLYSGLGGKPFWNSAIIAPRFLASAFAVGPSFILLSLQVIEKFSSLKVDHEVYKVLKRIIAVTLVINLFLLVCELFKEFYTDSVHSASAQYLFTGLHGYHLLVPFIWTAIVLNIIATITYISPGLNQNRLYINIASGCAIVGIWIEKGMGLIVPGFIPTPLGDIVEYAPSLTEIQVCVGIWATGFFIFTLLLKAAIPIESGKLRWQEESLDFPKMSKEE
ncbi:MAG TPA: polysulfide reductase [Deltaproteobacteria bacterium]|nr:MAG: polysulfide reductase [Deltaproteobacteria bacterium GWA2_45_12]HBF13305.1 polysulfide reductase [Deltaproteobacteria bacterium]